MAVPEKMLTLIALIITAIGALFCVIGLATSGWYGAQVGLFCNGCASAPQALSILSFILLIVAVVAFILQFIGVLRNRLLLIPIIVIFVATIFLLGTIASVIAPSYGYSFDLIVVAHFISYAVLAIAAFSLGQAVAVGSS